MLATCPGRYLTVPEDNPESFMAAPVIAQTWAMAYAFAGIEPLRACIAEMDMNCSRFNVLCGLRAGTG
jgi:hypothetical protein